MATGMSLHIGLNVVDPNAYGGWDGQLSGCINDANSMEGLARRLGYRSMKLTNSQATSQRVLQAISSAAQRLQRGDIFLLTYSGHGGQVRDVNSDEADSMDETWVLFDREVVDDELHSLWAQFPGGVRIFVLSDSCHSGTVAKMRMARDLLSSRATRRRRTRADAAGQQGASPDDGSRWADKPKGMPLQVQWETYKRGRAMYDQVQWIAGPARDAQVAASLILISGCQDNQLSYDGDNNGQFTGALLRIWDNGGFRGDYRSFHRAILNRMPPEQSPNYLFTGASNPAFEGQKPFTIDAAPAQGGGGQPVPTTTSRPTLRRGASGEHVKYLQQRLQAWGYSLRIDGKFGSDTYQKVRQFQSHHNLGVDGIVGRETWAALEQRPQAGSGAADVDSTSGSDYSPGDAGGYDDGYDTSYDDDYGGSHDDDYGGSHDDDYGGSYDDDYGSSHDDDYGGSHDDDYGGSHDDDYGGSYDDDYGSSYDDDYGGSYDDYGDGDDYWDDKDKDTRSVGDRRPEQKRGDRGKLVIDLKKLLEKHGYRVPRNAIFGPVTESHVRAFQHSVGLPVTGKVDQKTWNALAAVIA